MKKILLILYFLIQNSLLFASPTDTLSIYENETKLLTNDYFLELDDPSGSYTIKQVLASKGFHSVHASLPSVKYSESTIWLKFVLRNSTTRAFVPITIGGSIIDNFDLYFANSPGGDMIHLSSAVPYRDTKLIKQTNTFINAIIFPDSVRTIYLRIKSRESTVIPVEINSANSFFKNADFENIVVGGFMGIILVMALYNLVLFTIVRDKSYLYYVAYIIFLGLSQILQKGYGTNLFITRKPIVNDYLIPLMRIGIGYSIILFAAEFLQLKLNLKSYIKYYYSLLAIYTIAFIAVIFGKITTAYDFISIAAAITSLSLLAIGIVLYFRGFKPAKYFMIGWGLFLISVLISIARNRGFIEHNSFTLNIILYSSVLQLVLFSVSLAAKINFYRRQNAETQLLSLTIAKENERLITQQNISLETEVKARTQQLIGTNESLSKIIEDLRATQLQLIETEKMASLGQLTAGIAHEINNPINFVSSNVKPLRLDFLEIFSLIEKYKEASLNADKRELMESAQKYAEAIGVDFLKEEILSLLSGIEEGAGRTTEIVQSLRTFSRTDELILKPADINKAILNTLILLRSTIPYNIEIKPVLNKLPLLNCYPGKINQVLMNLINNSIQAIKAKGQHHNESITIQTTDNPENIIIEITDTGIGISLELKQRIFEPFFTTKEVGEGTGLGLSIVFGIIEDHHGEINVHSEPGRGTTFILTLPKNLE
jgi:hypothetical protein